MHSSETDNDSSFPHITIYHVAGVDDRERGFNRQVHIVPGEAGFQAMLRYETLQIVVDPLPLEDQVLARLIHLLHERGYRQLRTQRLFIGDRYLGNQEVWVEYPDPDPDQKVHKTWWMWLREIFRPSRVS
jgi:hypothetical protein